MGLFDIFKPGIDEMIKNRDLTGLIDSFKSEKNPYKQRKIIDAFGDIGDKKAIEPLIEYTRYMGARNHTIYDSDIKDALISLIKINDPIAIDFVVKVLNGEKVDITHNNKNIDIYSSAFNKVGISSSNLLGYFDITDSYQANVFYKLILKIDRTRGDSLFNVLRNENDDKRREALLKILQKLGGTQIIEYIIELIKSGKGNASIYGDLSSFKDPRIPSVILNELERIVGMTCDPNDYSTQTSLTNSIRAALDILVGNDKNEGYDDPLISTFLLNKLENADFERDPLTRGIVDQRRWIFEYLSKRNHPVIAEKYSQHLTKVAPLLATEIEINSPEIFSTCLEYRLQAIQYLGRSGNSSYIGIIKPFLRDDHIHIREAAARAFDNLNWNPDTDRERVDYLFAEKIKDDEANWSTVRDTPNRKRMMFFHSVDNRDWNSLLTYPNTTKEAILDLLYQIPYYYKEYPPKFSSVCQTLFGWNYLTAILESAGYDREWNSSRNSYRVNINNSLKATEKLCRDDSTFTTSILQRIVHRKNVIVPEQIYGDFDGVGYPYVDYRYIELDFSPQRTIAQVN